MKVTTIIVAIAIFTAVGYVATWLRSQHLKKLGAMRRMRYRQTAMEFGFLAMKAEHAGARKLAAQYRRAEFEANEKSMELG